MLKQCKRNKAYYTAHRADAAHHKSIRNAHSGVRKTPSELRAIADIIEPLIAKGVSFSPLTVADVTLICCHINSVLRENLDNKTSFDLMDSKDRKKLLSLLQLSPIPPDEVTLSPKLLKR